MTIVTILWEYFSKNMVSIYNINFRNLFQELKEFTGDNLELALWLSDSYTFCLTKILIF